MARRNKNNSGGKTLNNKLIPVVIALIASIVIVGAGIIYAVNYFNTQDMRNTLETDTIYPNILINGINVGGLKKEDAIKKLEQDLQEPFSQNTITFVVDDENVDFTYGQFGIKYNIEKAVEQAYNYARSGSIEERYDQYERLKMKDVYSFEADFLDDEGELPEEVKATIRSELEKNLKDKVYIEPKNATIKRENGKFEVGAEKNGRELDLDRAVDIVVDFITINKGDDIQIQTPIKESAETPVKDVQAKVTSEQVSQIGDLIGQYSTKYSGSGSSGRVTNMRVAASRLNGTVVYPGETFSTNKCFGESTPENGYKLAGAYINGKLDEDYGGGVCQVSSTLYNAVLRAELSVVERANHSLTVGYVPRGFDATLAGDYIDFKFKNDFDIPVYIESYLSNNQVVINIYGKEVHSPGRTLEFTSTFANKVYKTYKEVYQDGKFVEKVYLSRSIYKNIDEAGRVIVEKATTAPKVEPSVEITTQAVNKKKQTNTVANNNNTNTNTNSNNSSTSANNDADSNNNVNSNNTDTVNVPDTNTKTENNSVPKEEIKNNNDIIENVIEDVTVYENNNVENNDS